MSLLYDQDTNKTIPNTPTTTAYLATVVASYRAAILAWATIYMGDYPGYREAREVAPTWVGKIFLRNIVFTLVVCGFWDWWLYFSPMKERLFKNKITPRYPRFEQFVRDAKYTTIASTIAAAMECVLCHLWATGALPYQANWWDSPVFNFVGAGCMVLWRGPHFYLIHRVMHPWRISGVPDVGSFLNRNVHYLHHKSGNPTAWCSHDGFVSPGAGSTFHMLHHSHFDCNYGAL